MYVVIFRATLKASDPEYTATAARLRTRAIQEFGCTDFVSCQQNDQEITLSYWPSREQLQRWKQDPEHRLAQKTGRQKWYLDYRVEVAEIPDHPE